MHLNLPSLVLKYFFSYWDLAASYSFFFFYNSTYKHAYTYCTSLCP